MEEIWADINGFCKYPISNLGTVDGILNTV